MNQPTPNDRRENSRRAASLTGRRGNAGFTLVEVLLVMIVSAAVLAFTYRFLSMSIDATRAGEDHAGIQQNLRIAGEMTSDQIRQAGYGIDYGNGQLGLVYAGPWEIVFNANLNPEPDTFGDPRVPVAMSPAASPATVPATGTILYTPPRAYGTGAETVRFSLDSDNDGSVTSADRGDDEEEDDAGARDFVLCRYVYGSDSTGSNGGAREKIALCCGPISGDTDPVPPIFQYFYDDDSDSDTPLKLWGDSNQDLELDAGEIATVGAIASAQLPLVKRVRVELTGDPQKLAGDAVAAGAMPPWQFRTEIALRNRPRTLSIIRGYVFSDNDNNGLMGAGETGLANARVMLNTGARVLTTSTGRFSFEVDPGSYTVTETDPSGFSSTTPNLLAVSVAPGQVSELLFGDRSAAGYGYIHGTVYRDTNGDGVNGGGEAGITNVIVYLNTGAHDTTDASGRFLFYVPVTSYTVSEVDSTGYLSTTPNQVNVTIAAENDSVLVEFGDVLTGSSGTIAGHVFEDENENSVQDAGESGIPEVRLFLDSGDSTTTDFEGYYAFSVASGTYEVTEVDPEDYVSITPNVVSDVFVAGDSTTTVNFGDKTSAELNFDEIILADTDRALSVRSADFNEDNKNDSEIILGTRFVSGINNILAYFNSWTNANTPNTSIFSGTATYTRSGAGDVAALALGSLDGNAYVDVVTGLSSTSSNIKTWLTQTSGSNKGKMPTSPNATYSTTVSGEVLALALADVLGSTDNDLIVGTKTGTGTGRIEIWTGNGAGGFTLDAGNTYTTNSASLPFGEVRSIAVGQLNGGGGLDIVVGTKTTDYAGRVEVLFQNGSSGNFIATLSEVAHGHVNAVAAVDMVEDGNADLDILAGTSVASGTGEIALWHGTGSGGFGIYLPEIDVWTKSDSTLVDSEILSLKPAIINPDIYPDICVGTRTQSGYSGSLSIYMGFGYLPSSGTEWSGNEIGEVTTLDTNDFNKDGKNDIVVGTRTGSTSGKLVVYFQQ